MVAKPNQNVKQAPLRHVPAFDELFSRVVIDYVGPMPKINSGNSYLLTIMSALARFQEAIPFRKISSQVIIKALIKFLHNLACPKKFNLTKIPISHPGFFNK